jgi:hypothetical protein
MRRASRITASVLRLFAGGAGIEHGIYEILQGNAQPLRRHRTIGA